MFIPNPKEYEKIVGKEVMDKIKEKIEKLTDKHILFINSTFNGGGVAEMLNSMVPLFNQLGLRLGWRVLHGNDDFFMVTKGLHNALQGGKMHLTKRKKELYYETNKRFSIYTHIDHDLVVVHDPQPMAMIDFYKKKQPWISRLHIDLSNPNKKVWDYLKQFLVKYDRIVVSHKDYIRNDIDVPYSIVYPAIDPLTIKNKPIRENTIKKYLSRYGIDRDKPIITQISRFDKWKDPVGVIKVFERVREKINSKLVLLGSLASDDPEGQMIFQKVEKAVEKSKYKKDIHILLVHSDILVNSLQRASDVILQKSLKEGFGLTVSEALYKGTPVVASKVGGIPLQIKDGYNGFLFEPKDYRGFAKGITKLVEDEHLRKTMGEHGREFVKKNFLITRLMNDWLDIFSEYLL